MYGYPQKVISKTNEKSTLLVPGILKVTVEKSRIGSVRKCTDPRIRIRANMPRIRNTSKYSAYENGVFRRAYRFRCSGSVPGT
jgi:hypothetical protein